MPRSTPSRRTLLSVVYEHPDWFRPLFAELDRRGIAVERLRATPEGGLPAPPASGLLFNRMSPSGAQRGLAESVRETGNYLARAEGAGVITVNGSRAWAVETSKVRQLDLLASLGLPHPRGARINSGSEAPEAAADLRFPVMVKPNVGGSGVGIVKFDTMEELAAAARSLDLGLDGAGLVQEYRRPRGSRITRVEALGGRVLYAIRIYLGGASADDPFNLCPADVCRSRSGETLERGAVGEACPVNALEVEAFSPPPRIVEQVERIFAAAEIDVGGVEYLEDDETGEVLYYDINALSNFVADPVRVLGFDPFARLVDWLEERIPKGV